jgi:S-adenosylmethionine decarboxylase
MGFKANEKGYEVTAIFNGVDLNKINDYTLIKNTSLDLLKSAGFNVLDSVEHKFNPQGYTFVVLLSESHFAVHTYPEYETIYFHLYSCGDKDEKIILEGLKKKLNPKKIIVRKEDVQVKF